MNSPVYFCFLFMLIFAISFDVFSQTDIYGGDVRGTWQKSGSPYRIFDNITIPDDSTLSIEAGVLIEFQGHYNMNVQGRLLAVGTKTDSIVFTVNDTTFFSDTDTTLGGWNGIRFIDTSEDNDTSRIEYCILQYGKAVAPFWHDNSGGAICVINFDKVRISHCRIIHNLAGGSDLPTGGAIHMTRSDIRLDQNRILYNQAHAGGGIYIYESDPVFKDNIISYNFAQDGGGILVRNRSNPIFAGDSIINNQAVQLGGGLMCWDSSTVHFDEVVILSNTARWGGGIGLGSVEVQIDNCLIQENSAIDLGGGISADFSIVRINDTKISLNSANMSGGLHAWYCDLEVNESEISNNSADFGGGIHMDFSQLELLNSAILENQAINGGGLHIWNSDLMVDSCQFDNNHAFSQGGAIEYNLGDTLIFGKLYQFTTMNSQFNGNNADFRAGGVRIEQFNSDTSMVEVYIDQCVYVNNHADRLAALSLVGMINDIMISNSIFNKNTTDRWNGGASFSGGSSGSVINCEFSDNHAMSGNPGASGVSGGSFVRYLNCTFTNNSASKSGGLFVHRDGKASATNCIFWDNYPQQVLVLGIFESAYSELYINYCNIQYGQDSVEVDSLAALHWGDGNIDEDPLFTDAENANFRLLDDSPCIDAGIDSIELLGIWYFSPLTDIEGNSRMQTGEFLPDMGAYENQAIIGLEDNSEKENLLMNVYPNPFRQTITFDIKIKHTTWISMKVYNQFGTEIARPLNGLLKQGRHYLSWDAEELRNGMYFVRLEMNENLYTKKVILLR